MTFLSLINVFCNTLCLKPCHTPICCGYKGGKQCLHAQKLRKKQEQRKRNKGDYQHFQSDMSLLCHSCAIINLNMKNMIYQKYTIKNRLNAFHNYSVTVNVPNWRLFAKLAKSTISILQSSTICDVTASWITPTKGHGTTR